MHHSLGHFETLWASQIDAIYHEVIQTSQANRMPTERDDFGQPFVEIVWRVTERTQIQATEFGTELFHLPDHFRRDFGSAVFVSVGLCKIKPRCDRQREEFAVFVERVA